MRKILFARCVYTKKTDRRLLTTIEQEQDLRYVYKAATDDAALPYLHQLLKQGNQLQEYLGEHANIVEGVLMPDGRIQYPYVGLPTIQSIICEQFEESHSDNAYKTIDMVVQWLRQLNKISVDPKRNSELAAIYSDKLSLFSENTPCIDLGILDIHADNILYDQRENRFSLIDHEMVLAGPVPIDLVVFRFVFFTLLRLQTLFDVHADTIPTRTIDNGLLRLPVSWDINRWVEEARLPEFVELEEQLQAYYTGVSMPWPRSGVTTDMVNRQHQPITKRMDSLEQLYVALQHRYAEDSVVLEATKKEYLAYRQELEATNQRFDEYIIASKKAVAEYQHELASAQNVVAEFRRNGCGDVTRIIARARRAERLYTLTLQKEAATKIWLEGELQHARWQASQNRGSGWPIQRSPQALLRSGVRRVRSKLSQPVPKIRRRVKSLAKRLLWRNPLPSLNPSVSSGIDSVDTPYIQLSAVNGVPWQGPLVTILIPSSVGNTDFAEYLAAQTFQGFEAVFWDPQTHTAWLINNPQEKWYVDSVEELTQTLLGKYIWVLDKHISEFPETFLEYSVLSLESEELDFVVHSFADSAFLGKARRDKLFPKGSCTYVARAEMLTADLGIDIFQGPIRPVDAHVAGRLILHPTNARIADEVEWMPPALEEQDRVEFQNELIVLRSSNRDIWGIVHQVLHPIDTVFQVTPPIKEKQSILVLFPFLAVGGAEKLNLDILERLRDEYTIIVATVEPHDDSIGSMIQEYQRMTPYVYVIPSFLPHQLNFSVITYLIEKFQIDSMFVANGAGWIYDAAQNIRQRFPHLHMVNQVYDHKLGWIDRYDASLVQTFDRHVAPNQSIFQAYLERGVDINTIDLIYHGVELEAFDPAHYTNDQIRGLREQFGLPVDKPVVGFLARIHPQKRPLDFVALAQRFKPEEAHFFMVGDGILKQQIDDEVKRLRLKHLHRLSFHKPFADALAVCDIICIISEYEGLPLVLLNAQAMGKPVVATDVGAIREVLTYTGGGRVITKIGDVPGIERAIRDILITPIDMSNVAKILAKRFDIREVAILYGNSLRHP